MLKNESLWGYSVRLSGREESQGGTLLDREKKKVRWELVYHMKAEAVSPKEGRHCEEKANYSKDIGSKGKN